MFDLMKNTAQGALSSANDALSWFKPSAEEPSFKQPSYQGQGMLELGIQSTIPSTIAKPSMPLTQLSEQGSLKQKAPGVAQSSDQMIMNYSKAPEKKEWELDPQYLAMAMEGFKDPSQPTQMSAGRVGGGGFRAPQNDSLASQLQRQAFGEVAGHGAKKWDQMIRLPY